MELNLILLMIGFIFTFFLPGFLIIESFFSELPSIQKLPSYLLISVLVSTYAVYIVSLIFGFSQNSIIFTILIFQFWLIIFLINKRLGINQLCSRILRNSLYVFRQHIAALSLSLFIFALFLIALYPAIFTLFNNGYVMASVNWQDTAMHQSIIQTISQGNFPPEAPYFSGQPLNYYYFIDFHSAILQALYGDFFPRILVYDNPFFVLIFFLSIYALSYSIFRNKLSAIISGLLAVFSGNFLFIRFFYDLYINLNNSNSPFAIMKDLAANRSYTLDNGHLLQMVPMADYFLQNRPMMVGLPAIAILILLLVNGFEKDNKKYFILAGLLTAMLLKFQLFAFGVSILIFLLSWLIFLSKNIKKEVSKLVYLLGPLTISLISIWLLFRNNSYVLETFLNNLRLGAWDKTKDIYWYLEFPFANFGIPFVLVLLLILLVLLKRVNLTRGLKFLLILAITLFIIPFVVYFTIYDGDMLKFFYFAMIPFSIISGLFMQKMWNSKYLGYLLVIVLLFLSSANSFLTLASSFLNKYPAYSQAEYQAGMWIRDNTLPRSVFLSLPTVHSATSDIGGRLRVLSYTMWPYSHGFNKGEDNVFSRQADIETLLHNPLDSENVKRILKVYKVNYIYLGTEEKNKYPFVKQLFDQQAYLKLVYDFADVQIYKVL